MSRLGNLIRGFFSLFVSGLERKNPEALLAIEKENLRKQIEHYNQGLASHAGLCERLKSQVKKLEDEEKDLKAKTAANLRAGNRDAAGQYAMRLQTVAAQLKENREQYTQAENTYSELVSARQVAVRGAEQKIEQLKYALGDLKVKQATAELNEMAAGMIGSLGGVGRHAQPLARHGGRRPRKGRRARPGRAGFARHARYSRQGSRTKGAGGTGAGGFCGERGHCA